MDNTHVMFIGWNRPLLGREKNGLEVYDGFVNYLDKLVTDKQIGSFEPVWLTPHGGDLNSFVLIRGHLDDLNRLVMTDDWRKWISQLTYIFDGFGITHGHIGEEINTHLTHYRRLLS
ncbi:hypothetical protein ACFL6C_00725 [Myxococcota bacterium]